MRVTTHQGKGTSRHNFREFDLSKSDSIKSELSNQNVYFWNSKKIKLEQISKTVSLYKNEFSEIRNNLRNYENMNKFDNLSDSEKLELYMYNKLFNKTIKQQNERHISSRHYSRIRDILDYYINKNTQVSESILQVGNKDEHVSKDKLLEVYRDYLKEHNKRYGDKIKIISSTLHTDESTVHVHERKTFLGNKNNELCVNKNLCLKQLGFNLPNENQKESRYNNRMIEYSKECRELWIECCLKHDLEIETIPTNKKKHGLKLSEYKRVQEEKKLYNLIDEYKQKEEQQRHKESQWKTINSIKLKRSIEFNNEFDELKENFEQYGYIEKTTLDLLYQEYPELIEEYQNKSYDLLDEKFDIDSEIDEIIETEL